jgi:hypothetical protein
MTNDDDPLMEEDSSIDDDPSIKDPFRRIFGHTFYRVDSAAGTQKTRHAMRFAILETRVEHKTLIAMPAIKLIDQTVKTTIPEIAKELGVSVTPVVITSENTKGSIADKICAHISKAEGGQILFVTHEGLLRILDMPERINEWHLIIDEVFDPWLTSGVMKLRYSHFNLGLRPGMERGFGFVYAEELHSTLGEAGSEKLYYHIVPNLIKDYKDIWVNIRRHIYGQDHDQVYEIFKQVPLWLLQKEALFTHKGNWLHMIRGPTDEKIKDNDMSKGRITITGFRRPDRFLGFRKVTIMSALFDSTMLHNLWSRLGIEFKPSPDIQVNIKTVSLGSRRLRIGWLTDAVWSKYSRKNTGGIEVVFDIIAKSGLIDRTQQVGIVLNKDDSENLDTITEIRKHFPKHKVLPHNIRGSNMWTHLNQLIYVAALNPVRTDVIWKERALGIDSVTQRLGRVGHEIYQTLMRLGIRLEEGTDDITVVVSEKMIADWLVQHFSPQEQVEVISIDNEGQIYKPKPPGRPKSGKDRKTQQREASKRLYDRKKAEKNKSAS